MHKRNLRKRNHFTITDCLLAAAIVLAVFVLCVCVGSVQIPLKEIGRILLNLTAGSGAEQMPKSVTILSIRIPRVICAALEGAALSAAGCAMQGLLRNPLADGSTLGVASGASLGACLAIALGISFPFLPFAGTLVMAVVFAFLSLILILGLAFRLDRMLSTNTIILIGVIFSMFVSSLMNIIVTFASDKLHSITFWVMGSLSSATWQKVILLGVVLLVCGGILIRHAVELNAFAIGEEQARHIGVNVSSCKMRILIMVSIIIGVCVAVGGQIAFVGLVTPHMVRMIVGPNHRRLLPASIFGGAVFLMLSDLIARVLVRPLELPIGVITSLIGAAAFIVIFANTRKRM